MEKNQRVKQTTIGIISIGQSKDNELMDEMEALLDESLIIQRIGILDFYNKKEILEKFKPVNTHEILISTLNDGSEIVMNERVVIDEIQQCINRLEESVDIMLLLCTSEFPQFKSNKPLIVPSGMLHAVVKAFTQDNQKIGVIVPEPGQIKQCEESWKKIGLNPIVRDASPYSDLDKLMEVASAFKQQDDLVLTVLDCMGYTCEMESFIRKVTDKPVILSRTSIAYIVNELI